MCNEEAALLKLRLLHSVWVIQQNFITHYIQRDSHDQYEHTRTGAINILIHIIWRRVDCSKSYSLYQGVRGRANTNPGVVALYSTLHSMSFSPWLLLTNFNSILLPIHLFVPKIGSVQRAAVTLKQYQSRSFPQLWSASFAPLVSMKLLKYNDEL